MSRGGLFSQSQIIQNPESVLVATVLTLGHFISQALVKLQTMADTEFDLSPLLALEVESPAAVPANMSPVVLPEAVARPISKRRGKKRSSRACTTCRARKVRCNIVAHGAPCSNCRHDEIDCVLPLSRRQRLVYSPWPCFWTPILIEIQVGKRKSSAKSTKCHVLDGWLRSWRSAYRLH